MRAIIILAVIALLMGLAGWLTLGTKPGQTSINIETGEIRRDTENAAEKTERMLEAGARAFKGNNDVIDQQPTAPTPQPTLSQPTPIDTEPVTAAPRQTPVTNPDVTQ
jgi:hypothetical protein